GTDEGRQAEDQARAQEEVRRQEEAALTARVAASTARAFAAISGERPGTMWRFAITAILLLLATQARAQEALGTYKSLSPEIALDLARAALSCCRERGFQVAVAVVDRFGVTQVLLRDRFAGAHTVTAATGKAWTAVTTRTNTSDLVGITQPGMPQAGMRTIPGIV